MGEGFHFFLVNLLKKTTFSDIHPISFFRAFGGGKEGKGVAERFFQILSGGAVFFSEY